ncbi:DUF1003 domain-containing protein [Paenibacillus filicis]|uniref:DUF1003 domain-containing protein n=1 Tax=Paenibacillus gyeongsangnamensis TaxID=3388067 RepID=A0ABT4QEQ8_9BACL|nr:DUF1003 domain-containing protein [Paenibacillus filicis]MCZ8515364.1 DUF1003 domain-containing protein [Paenibacillus filicis]
MIKDVKKYRLKEKIEDEVSIIDTLENEEDELQELNEMHVKRLEKLITEYKGRIKSRLNLEQQRNYTWSERFADSIASFGGSWNFIILFACFLLGWVVWNSFLKPFDPPPFILLNLILSFIAGFQAPVILMSQNRQAARDKHEAMIDFAINYKAEQENVEMQKQLNRIKQMLNELTHQKTSDKQKL